MKPNKVIACLSYLLLVLGWMYVFIFRRRDRFAVFHAKQAMVITIAAIAAPAIWLVFAWLIVRVRLIGPVVAAAMFAIVIAALIFLVAVWIVGMVDALQARMRSLPVVGGWARRLPIGD